MTKDASRPADDLPILTTGVSPNLEALMRLGQAWNDGCRVWQEETFRFTSTRLAKDAEFARRLIASRDVAEAIGTQQAWAAGMAEDLVATAQRVLELAASTGAELMPPASTEPAKPTKPS